MTKTENLRAMVAPIPSYQTYPTPWREAEKRGKYQVVVCADGCYTAECPSDETAEIIVAAVNEFAAKPADPHKVELMLTAAFWGSPCTGNALEIARKALAALAIAGYTVIGPDATNIQEGEL